MASGLSPKQRQRWRDLVEWVQEEVPVQKPVRVVRAHVRRDVGDAFTGDMGDHYEVVVDRRLGWGEAVYALVEEVAHCMRGFCGDDTKDHDTPWGACYADARNRILSYLHEED